MDEEPVARALLVAGVTCLTVGLVTLALGIVFVFVDLHDAELLVVWVVAIASGVGSIVAGAQVSSFTCHGRSARPLGVCCLVVFVGSVVVGVGLHVALSVLSSFHVMKDGSHKEIFIFFLASSTIQMAALVMAPLLLACNSHIKIPTLRSKTPQTAKDSSDNYGFIGDSEMWCSSRPTKSTNLSRWPGMEHLESVTARSSNSSVTSIHPGHYIAGDHHPKFIGPSSEDAYSTSTAPSDSTVFETPKPLQTPTQNGTRKGPPNPNGVVYAQIHPPTPKVTPKLPVRPPRQRDALNKSEKIAVSTVSRSYSPLGSPGPKRIFLYDPVEMDISTPQTKRANFRNEQTGNAINAALNAYEEAWVPRKGIFGHNLHGINVNGLQALRTANSLRSKSRPKDPPPDVPNGAGRGSSFPFRNGDVDQRFVVGDWEDLNSPIEAIKVQATSTPKHSRKVTFLESES